MLKLNVFLEGKECWMFTQKSLIRLQNKSIKPTACVYYFFAVSKFEVGSKSDKNVDELSMIVIN